MRADFEQIKADFKSINDTLKDIADKICDNLNEILEGVSHIDRIGCRIKAEDSFLNKVLKTKPDGTLKYQTPLKEIQDFIGARIIVYYKTDVEKIRAVVEQFYQRVESNYVVPDDVSKFGYEGYHLICFIPNTIYADHKSNPLIPDFFELQIKTLYQHAWSQSGHGLGYKPETPLTEDQQRKLAFLAAQSWGADVILADLVSTQ